MPTEIEPNELLMRCSCGDRIEHVVWLIHDDDDKEHPVWYLMTSLDRRFGFWRRMWTAIRFVLRPKKMRYYGYAEVVLRDEDIANLEDFIMRRRNPELIEQ